jgi:hypothetical protein
VVLEFQATVTNVQDVIAIHATILVKDFVYLFNPCDSCL